MTASKRAVQSRRFAWFSGSDDGPCCSTAIDQPPSAMRRTAVPWFQWSSRLNPPKTTLAVVTGVPPPWRDNASTIAGSPFASVRLFPMNRTRPSTGGPPRDGSGASDGAAGGDELQLARRTAATMAVTMVRVPTIRAMIRAGCQPAASVPRPWDEAPGAEQDR
jgi:hypothetical protein